jgi:hypothetical protein
VTALVEEYADRPGPAGLLSYSVFTGTDGTTLWHHSLWRDGASHLDFRAEERRRADRVAARMPGVERTEPTRYHLYQGRRTEPAPRPGALVVVRVGTENAGHARAWVDAVLTALETDEGLPAGGIGGFFHISEDGTRVLNHAEWTSVTAHEEAVAAGAGSISQGPAWDRVRTMPGVRHLGVDRFHLTVTLTPQEPG